MCIEARGIFSAGWLLTVVVSSVILPAHAFEPGSERVCTASADGQRFECREKSTGEIVEPKAKALEAVAPPAKAEVAPVASAPVKSTSTTAAIPEASSLPNYLMQNPSTATTDDEVGGAPAAAERPAKATPAVPSVEPAAVDTSPTEKHAAPAMPSAVRDAQDSSASHDTRAPHSTAERASATQPAVAAAAPIQTAPRAMPEAKPAATSAAASQTQAAGLPGASVFLTLPANEYTLVLASERDPSALAALINALDAQAGQLYLLKLRMPDGDWYSLCWSAFEDIEAARAARAKLPADAPIRSGWPRRIGLLQQEIAR